MFKLFRCSIFQYETKSEYLIITVQLIYLWSVTRFYAQAGIKYSMSKWKTPRYGFDRLRILESQPWSFQVHILDLSNRFHTSAEEDSMTIKRNISLKVRDPGEALLTGTCNIRFEILNLSMLIYITVKLRSIRRKQLLCEKCIH